MIAHLAENLPNLDKAWKIVKIVGGGTYTLSALEGCAKSSEWIKQQQIGKRVTMSLSKPKKPVFITEGVASDNPIQSWKFSKSNRNQQLGRMMMMENPNDFINRLVPSNENR